MARWQAGERGHPKETGSQLQGPSRKQKATRESAKETCLARGNSILANLDPHLCGLQLASSVLSQAQLARLAPHRPHTKTPPKLTCPQARLRITQQQSKSAGLLLASFRSNGGEAICNSPA